MNALLTILCVLLALVLTVFIEGGAAAIAVCAVCALVAGLAVSAVREQREFLLQIFVGGLLVRIVIGTVIYSLNLQDFFGGDAITYDALGWALCQSWRGDIVAQSFIADWGKAGGGLGMVYLVAAIYYALGRGMLAVQLFNSVVGAATAPVIFLCAWRIFRNMRVAKLAAFCVAFYPSLVLWSSQALKDGPIVFLLALSMLATLELGERFSAKYLAVLALSLVTVITLRFYVFYMVVAAVGGAFLVGMRPQQGAQGLARQVIVIAALGLSMTYFGVLRTAGTQLETFANLEAVQRSRADLAGRATSGFAQDVDVSTTGGAISFIPVGFVYLLFAPFPWQVANLRQSITIPEMIVWWASFPLLVLGIWFTLKFRLRQALPILLFTAMLTLAYSVFQGNIGTAYRQRSQLLVFYFIFVAAGAVLLKERQENRKQEALAMKQAAIESWREAQARRRLELWKEKQEQEIEDVARDISERIKF
ncbi:MAG TPA: glycosyltransferase family 39 protein [Pyrinomonadaceae bacterium]|nr:glycosyltransferase family 39 protein [Pyrinomonadaceae bacterium]